MALSAGRSPVFYRYTTAFGTLLEYCQPLVE